MHPTAVLCPSLLPCYLAQALHRCMAKCFVQVQEKCRGGDEEHGRAGLIALCGFVKMLAAHACRMQLAA